MDHKLHFISGLPRSGSTLLAGLLKQNPRFHAGMSSPLAGMFTSMMREMSAHNEFSMFISEAQRERVLRGLFSSYYGAEYPEVVFDTNRAWCAKLNSLHTLFPQSRVIACVRHVPWVYDSVERLTRNNALQHSMVFGYQSGATVYTRMEMLAHGNDGLVGFAYNALREAFYTQEAAKQMLVLQYETLMRHPAQAMAAVYEFLGEPVFEHDFEKINFDAKDYDVRAGSPGMHSVRPKLAVAERAPVLPPELFNRFGNDDFWRNPALNPFKVRVV